MGRGEKTRTMEFRTQHLSLETKQRRRSGADEGRLITGDSDDDSVGSDLYKGDEDRRRLAKMSELDIEIILADLLNKRNDEDLKNNIKKHKEKSNQSRKNSSPPHTANRTMRSSVRTADRAKAKDEQLNEGAFL
ncbi:hypothetical protein Tco_0455611 [Tanacetum coccineum]